MVCSVTEGREPLETYPLMFRTCEVVVVNKINLLEHLDSELDLLLHDVGGMPRPG